MLLELQIRDFAIIDRLHLRLEVGFNVLTGETGAGKSIIIDALGTLRGERTDITFVRAGSARARVEGVFSLADSPQVLPLLREYGLNEEEDDQQVILTREVSAESGRSVARINGRAVSMSVLREVGGQLIDIHGQHEGLSLFNTRTHLEMLDRFGELLPLRDQVAALVARLRKVRDDLAELRRSESRRHERIEELHFLLEDVAATKLRLGEDEELLRERTVLQNGARITGLVNDAYAKLYQGEEGNRQPSRPIVESLATVSSALTELARYDTSLEPIAAQASDLQYQIEELATTVRGYRDQLDFEPGRLDEIEDRMTVLRELQRKHGGDIAHILDRAASAEAEIERLTNSAEHMAELEGQENRLLSEAGALAATLSSRRKATGETLAAMIEGAMGDLAMPNVRFSVQVAQADDAQGLPIDSEEPTAKGEKRTKSSAFRRLAFDKTGIDQVEFLISPNPGEPLKPLARVASGGESARLLLALKSILSRVDEVSTLIFDEIDVGVGGRAGQVVGQKLWTITEAHQVICITHLPQVAAFADTHFHISKEFEVDRTRTRVRQLSEAERIDELASMLDGAPSDYSRGNAREIVQRAEVFKQQQRLGRGGKRLALNDRDATIVAPANR